VTDLSLERSDHYGSTGEINESWAKTSRCMTALRPPLRRRVRAAQRRRPAALRRGTKPHLRKRLALFHNHWHLPENHIAQKTRVGEGTRSASRLSGSLPASAVRGTRAGLLLPCSRLLIYQGRNRLGLHLSLVPRPAVRWSHSLLPAPGPSVLGLHRPTTSAEDGDGQLSSAGSAAHASASLQMQKWYQSEACGCMVRHVTHGQPQEQS
jgi:hypothetical protein